MIKVFFDHQKFTTQRYGGISRYFATIIKEIQNRPDFEYLIGVLYSDNYYIANEKIPLNSGLFEKIFKFKQGSLAYKTNQAYCRYLLNKGDFDVFHPTYYNPYFLENLKKPFVTTVHDMTYEMLPEYFWANDSLSYEKRLSIERANHIIAISETTKRDIVKFNDINPDKISVIYHGTDVETPLSFEEVSGLPENYLLYVGDRSGYKNFYLFIRAYARIKKEYPDIKVVMAGGGALGIGDVEFLRRMNLSESVLHYQVNDQQLNTLYKNALAFIYPSLYEGFGLPILEAFKAGCPILLSDTDCFREIGGDACLYFNCHDEDDLTESIKKLIGDKSIGASLVTNGKIRLLNFTLENSINKTLDVYKKVI
ncbi:glycosyltransferase family 4 protein [Pedobacter sp. PWIIR3]